jgi:hypothetical protein
MSDGTGRRSLTFVGTKEGLRPLAGIAATTFLTGSFFDFTFLWDVAFLTFDLVAIEISFERVSSVFLKLIIEALEGTGQLPFIPHSLAFCHASQ